MTEKELSMHSCTGGIEWPVVSDHQYTVYSHYSSSDPFVGLLGTQRARRRSSMQARGTLSTCSFSATGVDPHRSKICFQRLSDHFFVFLMQSATRASVLSRENLPIFTFWPVKYILKARSTCTYIYCINLLTQRSAVTVLLTPAAERARAPKRCPQSPQESLQPLTKGEKTSIMKSDSKISIGGYAA